MTPTQAIELLVAFSVEHGLIQAEDVRYTRNILLYAIGLSEPSPAFDEGPLPDLPPTATPMLKVLVEHVVLSGAIVDMAFYREQLSAHLMNLLTPPPSQLIRTFESIRGWEGVRAATDWFYHISRMSDYIRVDQIERNIAMVEPSPYGDLQITINLSKPEKDPNEIARAKYSFGTEYPKCMLCVENEGYAGRPAYPSHETLRMIPIELNAEPWYFQYSPYSYYPEHCIVLNKQHTVMTISRRTFQLLLDFLDHFPHYFISSNADLPIVGGSILSHEHFQGGRHEFPMDKAPAYASFRHPEYSGVTIEAVEWPMTCVRLSSQDPRPLVALGGQILDAWCAYDDEDHEILHETDGIAHSTITPVARRTADGTYILQLVLRNNRTSAKHPLGIFHPHRELHHIKRENIGVIEVMGLFILPGRLLNELGQMRGYLTGEKPMVPPAPTNAMAQHYPWIESLRAEHPEDVTEEEASRIIRSSLSGICAKILEHAGVFKLTYAGKAGLAKFLKSVGFLQEGFML